MQDKTILEQLLIYDKLNFNEIQRKTRISPRKLKPKLSKLKEDGLVCVIGDKDWKRGKKIWFSLTTKGEKYLQTKMILEKTNWVPQEVSRIMVKQNIQKTINDLKNFDGYTRVPSKTYKITLLDEVPVETILWLNLMEKEKNKEVLQYLTANAMLERMAFDFVENMKYAILEVEKARYKRLGDEYKPFQFGDVLKQEEAFLKLNGMILFHFDGRKLAEKINWNEEYSKVKEKDKLEQDAYENFKRSISKRSPEQNEWIIDKILEKIIRIENSGQRNGHDLKHLLSSIFSDRMYDITANPWNILDEDSKLKDSFLESLFHQISYTIAFNHKTMKPNILPEKTLDELRSTIKRIFEQLLKEGMIEIAPVYLFRLNKEKLRARHEKQFKTGQGYPSPSIIPYPLNMLFRELGL